MSEPSANSLDPPPTPAPAAPLLGYGRTRRSYRRALKVALLIAAALVLVFTGRLLIMRAIWQATILRQQSTLLALTYPPDTVVWESDKAKAAALINGQAQRPSEQLHLGYVGLGAARPGSRMPVSGAVLVSPLRGEFDAAAGLRHADFTVFAGIRTAPGGRPRLVVVPGTVTTFQGRDRDGKIEIARELQLPGVVVEPATWARSPQNVTSSYKVTRIRVQVEDSFRIYAGQADVSDPSRFTIDYECNGVRGSLVCTLGSDDVVTIIPDLPEKNRRGPWAQYVVPIGTKQPRPGPTLTEPTQ